MAFVRGTMPRVVSDMMDSSWCIRCAVCSSSKARAWSTSQVLLGQASFRLFMVEHGDVDTAAFIVDQYLHNIMYCNSLVLLSFAGN